MSSHAQYFGHSHPASLRARGTRRFVCLRRLEVTGVTVHKSIRAVKIDLNIKDLILYLIPHQFNDECNSSLRIIIPRGVVSAVFTLM